MKFNEKQIGVENTQSVVEQLVELEMSDDVFVEPMLKVMMNWKVVLSWKVTAQYQFTGQHVHERDLSILLRLNLWLVRNLVPIKKLCVDIEVADGSKPWRMKLIHLRAILSGSILSLDWTVNG